MEQALVLASIVLGVAIAFELDHLNKVLRSRTVRWHWAQPLFAFFVLLTIISYWWGVANNAGGSITLGAFLPIMFQLIMLVLLAAVSLPDAIPEEGLDLGEYYQENRKYQWILMSLFFWTINIRWFANVWPESSSFADFAMRVSGDTLAGLLFLAMIFARRWWMVAIGFGILSLAPVIWLTRTLG
ncbi:hypothetical protein [Erythrobacter sp. MTPC3]|uniref:hypothetical protein n=1 Tax=Erythrobacter sp. MTPC3 TaxID=3056564 RepID=UPI0036F24308